MAMQSMPLNQLLLSLLKGQPCGSGRMCVHEMKVEARWFLCGMSFNFEVEAMLLKNTDTSFPLAVAQGRGAQPASLMLCREFLSTFELLCQARLVPQAWLTMEFGTLESGQHRTSKPLAGLVVCQCWVPIPTNLKSALWSSHQKPQPCPFLASKDLFDTLHSSFFLQMLLPFARRPIQAIKKGRKICKTKVM